LLDLVLPSVELRVKVLDDIVIRRATSPGDSRIFDTGSLRTNLKRLVFSAVFVTTNLVATSQEGRIEPQSRAPVDDDLLGKDLLRDPIATNMRL
jgi:hypothetical protein